MPDSKRQLFCGVHVLVSKNVILNISDGKMQEKATGGGNEAGGEHAVGSSVKYDVQQAFFGAHDNVPS